MADLTVNLYLASKVIDELADDAQPEARARDTGFAYVSGAEKLIPDMLQGIFGDADAGI